MTIQRLAPRVSAAVAASAGILALLGLASIDRTTAICFLLSAGALWILADLRTPALHKAAVVGSAAVALLGLAAIAELASVLNFGARRLVSNIGVAFVLLAAALICKQRATPRALWAGDICCFVVAGIALLPVLRSFYGAPAILFPSQLPLIAAIPLLLLPIGLLQVSPTGPFLSNAAGGPGGVLLRWLLPSYAVLHILLGRARLAWEGRAPYQQDLGVATATVANVILFTFALVLIALRLNRADAQRQSAQQALQESELRYRSIVDATFDGIVISENGVVRWGNPGLATMFGYDAGEMLGRPIVEFLTPESRALVIENIRAGKEGAWKITGRHKEGRAIFLEIVVKEHAVNGKQVRVAALRDITERHKLEEQIRQSSKMESLGRVAGGVAHDFNNLLMVINGHSDLIIKRAPAADPLLPSMLAIRKAGIRATALTQHLLAFSRKQVLDKKVIDVNGAVQESINMLRRVIPENIELAADLTPLPCSIEADPRHIDQLLMNLVVNARDAMPAGGLLRLETRIVELDEAALRGHPDVKAGVFVQLTVRDTGTGIDPQVLPHIFEPFFTTKDESHGTGLGLSTVFGEVNQAGGFITVETELGVGTAFHVCLPRLHGKDVAEPPRPESASSAGGQTILLVEDQLEVLNLVRMMLQSFGYKVHAASAAGDALRIAQTEKIHLLLTDVVMPDMGGPELAAAIRQQSPGIKTVFMSGYPKDSFPGQTAGDDNVAFLQKPVSAEALAAKIREVLGSS